MVGFHGVYAVEEVNSPCRRVAASPARPLRLPECSV